MPAASLYGLGFMSHEPLFTPARRRKAAIAVISLLLAGAVGASPLVATHTRSKAAAPALDAATGSGRLPSAAQGPVSKVIGRDLTGYHATATRAGFAVENAQHGLHARFGPEGVRVRAGQERLSLALDSYGYGNNLRQLASPTLRSEANEIVLRYGNIDEWYVNGPLGLEQGFTIDERPRGGSAEPLTVSLTMGGSLSPAVDPDGDGLTFPGSSMRYGGLFANDAHGKELPAHLELHGKQLLIRVDDRSAVYPLTIDPFFQELKFKGSDTAFQDQFGIAMAVSGDTLVVGAHKNQAFAIPNHPADLFGSAYVFAKGATGWGALAQVAKLRASDGTTEAGFGRSVAIDGDTIVVGAPTANHGATNDNRGAAYVFVKPPLGWIDSTETAKLTASDAADEDRFATSVGISGDTVVAGSQADIGTNVSQGAAYVFVKPAGGWASATQTAKLTASDGAANDTLGISVSISGDTIVAGAWFDSSTGTAAHGSAYVFVKPAGGWANGTQTAKLTASDAGALDLFGQSTAISGNTIVVGSLLDDGCNTDQGSAYVFVKPPGSWVNATQTAKLTSSGCIDGENLGTSVAISGDTIAVGAPGSPGATLLIDDAGATYVFVKPAAGWVDATETQRLTHFDNANGGEVAGFSVATTGDTVFAGAPDDGIRFLGPNAGSFGAAYVFSLRHALDVSLAGAGAGTVASVDPGIACGVDCAENFLAGSSITLNATPDPGSSFAGWTGDCAGAALSCVVTMSAARSVTATFGPLDTIDPTVALSSATPDPTNASPIPVTAQFDEPVTGFDALDVVAGNATVSNFVVVDGDTFTFDLTPTGQGPVTADVGAGAAQDGAGNDNTAASQFTRTSDTMAPTVALTSVAPNPVTTPPIPVTVLFSEAVNGFTAADVVAGNATVGNFTQTAPDTFSFDLIPNGPGLVTADVGAGAAQDGAGNGNTPANQLDRTFAPPGPGPGPGPGPTTPPPPVNRHTLTVTNNGGGIVTSQPVRISCGTICSSSFPSGSTVALLATPDPGFSFSGWSGACTADPCSFVITQDETVTATFEPISTAVCTKHPEATIVGTAGADVIEGTPGDDIICALGGADVVKAKGGNDIVYGGKGKDAVTGGPGDDDLRGAAGADRLKGGTGSDALKGGRGRDRLVGGEGVDDLTGGNGFDSCARDSSDDVVTGCESVAGPTLRSSLPPAVRFRVRSTAT